MNIQPIPYGSKSAVSVKLSWLAKEYLSDNVCIRAELFDDTNNIVDYKDLYMSSEEYFALGATKPDRLTAIIEKLGFFVLSN